MNKLAIIGGSGLTALDGLKITRQEVMTTHYGGPSAALTFGKMNEREIVFLPRHGHPHVIPPHRVNYRANIRALKDTGVNRIIAVNAVGGITQPMGPGCIVIPDQIIDYTWGRKHTCYEDNIEQVTHIDFTHPYDEPLRQTLIRAGKESGITCMEKGTYGVTQGPRLETAAEITRLERDGCDLVGMTGMPEAALAREMEIDYAAICLVVNRAAGKSDDVITMAKIEKNLAEGISRVCQLLEAVIPLLD